MWRILTHAINTTISAKKYEISIILLYLSLVILLYEQYDIQLISTRAGCIDKIKRKHLYPDQLRIYYWYLCRQDDELFESLSIVVQQ